MRISLWPVGTHYRPPLVAALLVAALLAQPLLLTGNTVQPSRLAPSPPSAAPVENTLESLPLPLQLAFSRDLGRDEPAYHLTSAGNDRFRASNPAMGLVATLDAQGMEVRTGDRSWFLALSRWGRGSDLRLAPRANKPVAQANRLELARGPLSEWWVNGPLGLQVGWTLAAPPAGATDQPLTLALTQGGTLRGQPLPGASGDPGSRGLALTNAQGIANWRWGGLMAYDTEGRELPAWLETGGDEVLLRVDDAGADYPVTIDPWVQASKLTTSTGLPGDQLGTRVAMSTDGSTVVTCAPYHPFGVPSGAEKGALYVYKRPGSAWVSTPLYRAKLTASDGATGDHLGVSGLGISDDGSTLVAGSPRHDDSLGAVYVFRRPAGGWRDATERAKLTAGDGASYDRFGLGVAVSGDGMTIAAGAPSHVVGALKLGAVYIYERPTGGWTDTAAFTAKLTNTDAGDQSNFGQSISLTGDGGTVVASAPYSHAEAHADGAVFVYKRPAGGWLDTADYAARLTASDAENDDLMGTALAVNDGGTVVVAGTPSYDGAGIDRGTVYVFQRPASGWATTSAPSAILAPSDRGDRDEFGADVAVSDDGATIVAGAPLNAGGASHRGALYLFSRPGDDWASSASPTAKLTSGELADDSEFGLGAALSGDGSIVAGGAPHHSGGGAVLLYSQPPGGWTNTSNAEAKLTASDGQDADKIGWSVAVSSDGSTVAAGAPWEDGGGTVAGRGAVYVYQRQEMGWLPAAIFGAKLMVGGGSSGDALGWAVAISDDGGTIVAAAPWHNGAGSDRGALYVFQRAGAAWATTTTYAARLTAAGSGNGDVLGWSVAVSGDGSTIAAGAPRHDAGGTDRGAVYVFERPPVGWTTSSIFGAKLIDSSGSNTDLLGFSVAASGDGATVAAGVPYFDGAGTDRGQVCVYARPGDGWSGTGAPTSRLAVNHGADQDGLGWSVATSSDGTTVAAGTPGHDAGNPNQGAVFLFERPASGWAATTLPAGFLTDGAGGNGDSLGFWVAVNGDGSRVAASAPNNNGAGTNRGAVHVYDRPEGGWPHSISVGTKLAANDAANGDFLGWAIDLSADGGTVVAGAPNREVVGTDRGAAYVFALLTAPAFTSGTPPSPATVGAFYSHQFTTSGFPPPVYSVQGGSTPPGLTLWANSGLLEGTPTTPGTYDFVVEADNGVTPAATQSVHIEVQSVFRAYVALILRQSRGLR